MMKECRTCLWREGKEELMCCQCNHISFYFREALKQLPLVGKYIPDYECKGYEMDKTLTGYPKFPPVNCRCSVVYQFEGDDPE